MKSLYCLFFAVLGVIATGCNNSSEVPEPMLWSVSATGDGVSCRYTPEDYPQIHINADYAAGEARMVCTNRRQLHFGFFDDPRAVGYDFGFGDARISGDTVIVRFEEDNVGGEARDCQILVSAEGEASTTIAVTRTFTEMERQRTSGIYLP